MPRYEFEEVSVSRVKVYKDENGKRRQVTRKFSQTINPFNKNEDGTIKTREEIYKELQTKAFEWMNSDNVSKY